jgi:hypothetical protein
MENAAARNGGGSREVEGEPRQVWVSPDGESDIFRLPVTSIRPAPENESVYRPVTRDDPDILGLSESIGQHGILDPLVVTRDYFILSGHRRHAAARMAGLMEVPCRVADVTRGDPGFVPLLMEYNRQRVKSFDEVVREEVIASNPGDAYQALLDRRKAASRVSGEFLQIEGKKVRHAISGAKRPFLEAVKRIVFAQRDYWPLSDRSIHYDVLNDSPLRNARNPGSRYKNDRASYQDLTDMLTRGRLKGEVPFDAIADPTREVCCWDVARDVGGFIKGSMDDLLRGYWRDLQQSQPNHIEIVGEKNTVESSIRPVAMEFCIPYTLGRGYCSLEPRRAMVKRFKKSGRSTLIVLVLSDFDPEGDDIPNAFMKSIRDDFGVENVLAQKVCLTYEQVIERRLAKTFDAKAKGSRYKKFVARYPDHPWGHELESLPHAERSRLLREAIEGVLDVDAFNREVECEREDAAKIQALRKALGPAIAEATRTMWL